MCEHRSSTKCLTKNSDKMKQKTRNQKGCAIFCASQFLFGRYDSAKTKCFVKKRFHPFSLFLCISATYVLLLNLFSFSKISNLYPGFNFCVKPYITPTHDRNRFHYHIKVTFSMNAKGNLCWD